MENYISKYREGYQQLLQEVDGLSEEELSFKPSPEKWSIREIVIHVVDTEMVHLNRMKSVIAEDNPSFYAFDQEAWTENLHYQNLDHRVYLRLFDALRESFAPVLESLNEDDFQRVGTHNEAGTMTLQYILEHAVDHVTNHIGQIRRVKAAYREQR